MLGPVPKSESPYRHNLKELAKIAQYEPIASIPQPSVGFNYTLVRNRYSDYYEVPKVMKKSPEKNRIKLATILETHGRSPLFPKINKDKMSGDHLGESASRKKIRGLRSYFKQQNDTTATSRERSLTIDTRLDSQEGQRNLNSSDFVDSKRHQNKPLSLGVRTAEREHLKSNGSELSLLISRRKQPQPEIVYKPQQSFISESVLNEQEQQESQGEQYEKDAVPGPGSYTYSYSDFDKARNTRSTNVSFLSKRTRFIYPQKQEPPKPENLRYEEKEQAREKKLKAVVFKKKEVPFNSCSPRKFQCDELSKKNVPGPENYYPRQGLEEQLIRKIQRNFKGSFGSQQPRFKYQDPEHPHLGPGTYDSATFDDTLQNENFYFKSVKERFE